MKQQMRSDAQRPVFLSIDFESHRMQLTVIWDNLCIVRGALTSAKLTFQYYSATIRLKKLYDI